MPIDPETVRTMAALAGLEIAPEDITALERQLEQIVVWVDELPPFEPGTGAHAAPDAAGVNALRPDLVEQGLSSEEALAGAPATDGDFFVVPRVLPPAKEESGF